MSNQGITTTNTVVTERDASPDKFVSNVKEVLSAITAEERTVKSLDLDKLPIERALRLQWDTKTDTFGVKVAL